MVEFKVIEFNEWRRRICPLWSWIDDWHHIPIINNPYGMIQYTGLDAFERMIVFPIMCTVDGVPAAYTNVYNISDTHIRIRGIYVEPEFRGRRLVAPMLDYACGLFPEPWHTLIGYYRTTTADWCKKELHHVEAGHDWRHRSGNGTALAEYKIILLERKYRDIS